MQVVPTPRVHSNASANQDLQAMDSVAKESREAAMVLSVTRMRNVYSPSMTNHCSASVTLVGMETDKRVQTLMNASP